MEDRKSHWEKIYKTKDLTEVSWYESKPKTSLEYIAALNLKKNAKIIDVGGGDSFLADHLLAEGYVNITVLDISEEALKKAKSRLGKKAEKIKWIVADVAEFTSSKKYDLWHDRAALHFLTGEDQIKRYLENLNSSLKKGGYAIIATFSEKGPTKCSGIEIKQYSLHELSELLSEDFEPLNCENIDHITPSEAVQNFTFCSFRKKF